MSIIDIVIIAILAAFALLGFKRGVFQSLVAVGGFIVIVCLSYWLKNYLGDFLVLNLPFSKYTFLPGGSIVLNVITYQMIAFIIVLVLLGLVYKIVLIVSGIFEKLLRITIVFGIPSKILGLIVGVLEGFIVVYLILFFVSQPFMRIDLLKNSSFAKTILKDTPIISNFANDTFEIINEIDETVKSNGEDHFDLKLTDLILKRNITSVDVMQKLVDDKKIEVEGIQEVINNYKGGNNNIETTEENTENIETE